VLKEKKGLNSSWRKKVSDAGVRGVTAKIKNINEGKSLCESRREIRSKARRTFRMKSEVLFDQKEPVTNQKESDAEKKPPLKKGKEVIFQQFKATTS